MNEETKKAAIMLGNALKPDFKEMDAVFRKYVLPDLEQVVAEKVVTMSPEELERCKCTTQP